MDKEFSNIRIVDIAKMAGVSVGTVDRVIHNRGRVSEENRKKVQAILEMVHYQPNLMARSLAASKKQYHILAITPSFVQGEYWEAISEGIDKAAAEMFSGMKDTISGIAPTYLALSFQRRVISSKVFPFVSGTIFHTNRAASTQITP